MKLTVSEELKREERACGWMFAWMQRKPQENLIWELPGTCGRGTPSHSETGLVQSPSWPSFL